MINKISGDGGLDQALIYQQRPGTMPRSQADRTVIQLPAIEKAGNNPGKISKTRIPAIPPVDLPLDPLDEILLLPHQLAS